jgi:hypothetical protein
MAVVAKGDEVRRMIVRLVVIDVVHMKFAAVRAAVRAAAKLTRRLIALADATLEFWREFVSVDRSRALGHTPMKALTFAGTKYAAVPKLLIGASISSAALPADVRDEPLLASYIEAGLRAMNASPGFTRPERERLAADRASLGNPVLAIPGSKAGPVAKAMDTLGYLSHRSAHGLATVDAWFKNVVGCWHNKIPSSRDSIQKLLKVGRPLWRAGLSVVDQATLARSPLCSTNRTFAIGGTTA